MISKKIKKLILTTSMLTLGTSLAAPIITSCVSNKNVTSEFSNYLLQPIETNIINQDFIRIETVGNNISEMYFSYNENLTNYRTCIFSKKINYLEIPFPKDYSGSLWFFGRTADGQYTNSIKFNILNSVSADYFNISIKGNNILNEINYKYKSSNPYLLNNELVSQDATSEVAPKMYSLAQKYSKLFLSFLKSIKSINFQDQYIEPSVQFHLSNILKNIDSYYVKGINFIYSPNNSKKEDLSNTIPTQFTGLQLEIGNKDVLEDNYIIAIAASINIDSNNITNSFLSNKLSKLGVSTQLFNNLQEEQDFFNNTNFKTIDKISFLKEVFLNIDFLEVPNQIPDTVINNIATNEYAQIIAYKVLAKQQSNRIKTSQKLYPGIDFNINNFPYESMGYINVATTAQNNPWLMGWSKYNKILSTTATASSEHPLFTYIKHEKNNFNINMFAKTDFAELPKLQIAKGNNLILKKIYGSNNEIFKESNEISPLGLMGLFMVNSFIMPNQSNGLSYIGNTWNFFGSKGINGVATQTQLTEIDNNIQKWINGIYEIYSIWPFDSIDFDYEYPLFNGSSTDANMQMSQKYIKLLEEMRKMLSVLSIKTGKTYKLSVAVNPNWSLSNKNWVYDIDNFVDIYNIMSYDLNNVNTHDVVGGNSKGRKLVPGGPEEIKKIVSGSSNNITLKNWVTNKLENVDKIPNYYMDVNSLRNLSDTAGNGVIDNTEQLLYKLNPKKVVFGLASYGLGWQIYGSGPLPQYPGSFGVTNKKVVDYQPGINSFIEKVKNKQAKFLFNPFILDNYLYDTSDPTGNWYYSMDFIESILYKMNWGKQKQLKGYMVWTINSQLDLNKTPNLFKNNVFDFNNVLNSRSTIWNLPIISTFSGLYSPQEIYNVWKNYLSNNFIELFGEMWNIK